MKLIPTIVVIVALFIVAHLVAGVALATPTYATVDGYEAHSSEANHPRYWCPVPRYKAGENSEEVSFSGSTYTVEAFGDVSEFSLIVVKSGSGQFANTIFEDVSAGQTVFADTNGNGISDPGGRHGDKDISHLIFCWEVTPSATPTPTAEPTPSPTSEPSPTTNPTPTATPTPSPTPTASTTPEPSASPSSSPDASPSASPSVTPQPTLPPTDTSSETGSGESGINRLLALVGAIALFWWLIGVFGDRDGDRRRR